MSPTTMAQVVASVFQSTPHVKFITFQCQELEQETGILWLKEKKKRGLGSNPLSPTQIFKPGSNFEPGLKSLKPGLAF